jgi:chorismate mutase/prephenate dehydratase
MDLKSLRSEIDEIDSELIRLFTKRMEICKKVPLYKKENGIPVLDSGREAELLAKASALAGEEMKGPTALLFERILELSRKEQESIINR